MMASTIAGETEATGSGAGSQTLMRGLNIIEALVEGTLPLADLARRLELSTSTTYRLAAALIERGYISSAPRAGYRLGPKLIELAYLAQEQNDLIQVARAHLEKLAAASEDTVHLGVLEDGMALYLDKVPGRRRITISSRIGDRQPLTSTGLGKALMLDHSIEYWQDRLRANQAAGGFPVDATSWLERMRSYAASGHAYDLEENEDQIRCVSAPIRDARGRIAGAISVSSAAQYMNDERMTALADEVRDTARAISLELGWTVDAAVSPHKRKGK